MESLKNVIRNIPDFPKPGIMFRDITPILSDAEVFRQVIDAYVEKYRDAEIDVVLGAESRGFIFGPVVAYRLGVSYVPVRKKGKLPYRTKQASYELEYGTDTLEIHEDAVAPGQKALLIDDLLATGGTMAACCELVESLGGVVVACAFVVELSFLQGRERLKDYEVFAMVDYESE